MYMISNYFLHVFSFTLQIGKMGSDLRELKERVSALEVKT